MTAAQAHDEEDRTIVELLRENPTPAAVWVIGAAVLAALEVGRLFAGLQEVDEALRYLLGGLASIPGWAGENIADFTGSGVAGTVMTLAVAAVLIFSVAILIAGRVPDTVVEQVDRPLSRSEERNLKRATAAAVIAVIVSAVLYTPVGAVLGLISETIETLAAELPALTSPETIPNEGHRAPDGAGWEGTFMGLSPAQAWSLRVGMIFAYVAAWCGWLVKGYQTYREHYRQSDWTPRDDTIRRFRKNYWGLFGLVVVITFVVMAAWAPALAPVPIEHNVYSPNNHEFEFLNDDGEVETINHVFANLDTQSDGQTTVGPWSYDEFDRWHPLGTTDRGQDMAVHLVYGARTSLVIGLTSILLAGGIAVLLSLMTAYYKGIIDIATVVASDTIISIPAFLLIMLLSVLFQAGDHPLAEPLDGGFLLALIFGIVYWPGIWRSIRGPSLQVAEEEWVDAAKSYGQTPLRTMKKHMAPYIAGYVMIYASLLIGSVIIFTAALTFLGLGINPPTPEWGRLIDSGQPYVATSSWHVATIPGLAIVFVVVAFNALGDALRDAIDPEADIGEDAATTGGGA